jgi:hypothetical protein
VSLPQFRHRAGSSSKDTQGHVDRQMSQRVHTGIVERMCLRRKRLLYLLLLIPAYFLVLFVMWNVRRVVVDVRPSLGREFRTNATFLNYAVLAQPECSEHRKNVANVPRYVCGRVCAS